MNSLGSTSRTLFLSMSLLFLCHMSGSSQKPVPPCGTVEYNALLELQYPVRKTREEDFEKWIARKIAERQDMKKRSVEEPVIRTIPVIFHIIHSSSQGIGNGVNISAEQVQSQLDVLNEDFRRTGNGFNDDPRGADIEIEFCLSLVNEFNQVLPEPGIMRWSNWGQGYFDRSFMEGIIKPFTSQDPTRFLNIWVAQMTPGLAGYAQFPDSSGLSGLDADGGLADRDGVVVIPTAIGTIGLGATTMNMGRTATHEIGHWLGLRHIWGDGNCTKDDYCNDTPRCSDPYYSTYPSCLRPSQCGSTRMIENYMDYSEGICKNIFTNGQKDRMDVVLANSPNRPFSEGVPTVCHPENLSNLVYSPKTVRSCGPMNLIFTNALNEPAATTNWNFAGISAIPVTSNQQIVTLSARSSGILNVQLQTTFAGVTESKMAQISVVILPTTDAACQSASCADGIRNGNETGIDCGGSCGSCNPDCDKVAVYNGPISLPEHVSASNLIEAGNLTGSGNINVGQGEQITLQASQILLQSGFNVSLNGGLEIRNGGCN